MRSLEGSGSQTPKAPHDPGLASTILRLIPITGGSPNGLASLIRAYDWGSTSLGAIESWPHTLLTYVNLALASPTGACLCWGAESTFFYNDALLPLIGNRHPDSLGQSGLELWASYWPGVHVDHQAVFAHGQSLARENAPIQVNGAAQHKRSFSYMLMPVYEGGKVQGVFGLFRDTTSALLEDGRLQQMEKLAAVGRLVSTITHEINNPLESVTNLIYLARTSRTLAEARDFLATADRELHRVSLITNQTLSFHKQAQYPQSVTTHELLESVVAIYRGRMINYRIQVEWRRTSPKPVLCFDGEIRQVLNNLFGNAIDAMEAAGGKILLSSHETTRWRTGERGLAITVADTGKGMSKETRARVFDAFFTTKGAGGAGLGLWLSQDIVSRHGGWLMVRSCQQPGRSGTVFTLFLPFQTSNRKD